MLTDIENEERVSCGSSWGDCAVDLITSNHGGGEPRNRNRFLGLRLVRTSKEKL